MPIALLLLFFVGHVTDAKVAKAVLHFHCRQDHKGSASEPSSAASATKAPAALEWPEPSSTETISCVPSGHTTASAPSPAAAAPAQMLGRKGMPQISNVLPRHDAQSHGVKGKKALAPAPALGTTKVLGNSKEHSAAHVTWAHGQTIAPTPAPAAKGAKRIWSIFSPFGTSKQALAEGTGAPVPVMMPSVNSDSAASLHHVAVGGTGSSAAVLISPSTSSELRSISRNGMATPVGTAAQASVPFATDLGWDGGVARTQHTGAMTGHAVAPDPSAARRPPAGGQHLNTMTGRAGGVPAPAPAPAWAGSAARSPAQSPAQPLGFTLLQRVFG